MYVSFSVYITVAMPKAIQKAKIACLDFSLQKTKMHLGIQVVIEQPDKLEAIRDRFAPIKLHWYIICM